MAENMGKWPSNRGPISKIMPLDGCKGDAVPLVVEQWYNFPEFGGYLGNVGLVCWYWYRGNYNVGISCLTKTSFWIWSSRCLRF